MNVKKIMLSKMSQGRTFGMISLLSGLPETKQMSEGRGEGEGEKPRNPTPNSREQTDGDQKGRGWGSGGNRGWEEEEDTYHDE